LILRALYKEGGDFVKQLYTNRFLISELTRRDFKTRYVENFLGLAWAIIEPLAMMVILWLVFTFLRDRQSDVPFVLYLLTGLIIYDFFSKGLNRGTRSILELSFLVKKVNFRIAVLPLVKLFSELIIHSIVLTVVMIILLFYGFYPDIYWLQFIYYLFSTFILLVGLTWITSSLMLFFRDISIIIGITMRVMFFLTPIIWSLDRFPPQLQFYLKLNPLTYLVMGYRNCFLYKVPFWEDMTTTLLFWSFTALVLILGIYTFKKLRPHFADVI